jgi:hypothetical protein
LVRKWYIFICKKKGKAVGKSEAHEICILIGDEWRLPYRKM